MVNSASEDASVSCGGVSSLSSSPYLLSGWERDQRFRGGEKWLSGRRAKNRNVMDRLLLGYVSVGKRVRGHDNEGEGDANPW